jgi:hypothetical protein
MVAMARIVLHPGYVSDADGNNERFVGSMAMAKAYGLDYQDHNVVSANGVYRDDDVHLFPRFDGEYQRVTLADGEG